MQNDSSGTPFDIKIEHQGWLDGSSPEGDACTHGRIRLIIGGVAIAAGEGPLGISESALALLRTMESDHCPTKPVAERLIFHGCGAMLMMGCPIGIDWVVTHLGKELVQISDVVWYPQTNEENAIRYTDLSVVLPLADYRAKVLAFAIEAMKPFQGTVKHFEDEYSQAEYDDFWREYKALANA